MTDRFQFRWGIPEWDVGSTDIPNPIFQYYSSIPWIDKDGKSGIGISNTEAMFILHLASYHFESEKGRCEPSLTSTLRKRMGYKTNQGIINVLQGLEHKNLILVDRVIGQRSTYDFKPFSQAVMELWRVDNPSENVDPSTKVDEKSSRKVDEKSSRKVDTKKKKEEQQSKEEKDYLLHLAEFANKQPNTAIPVSAGGSFTLGDKLITVACARMGRSEPEGKKHDKAIAFFEKALKAEGLLQGDEEMLIRAVKNWLDPEGEYGFFLPQYELTTKHELALRHFGIVLSKAKKAAGKQRAKPPPGGYEPVYGGDPEPLAGDDGDCPVGAAIKGVLRLGMSKPTFETYVRPAAFVCNDGLLTVTAPDGRIKAWLADRLASTIRRAAIGVVGGAVEVTFEVEEE